MKTVVIGASPNPNRYAYRVTEMLVEEGIETIPLGVRSGEIAGLQIVDLKAQPPLEDVHTVTLYLGPDKQEPYYQYILSLNPQRIIFNPGTENPHFQSLAIDNGIHAEYACTLVMLSVNTY